MNDYDKHQNDKARQDDQAHELIDKLNLLETVDRRINPEHVARRFRELLYNIGNADQTAPAASGEDSSAEGIGTGLHPANGDQPTDLYREHNSERQVDLADLTAAMEVVAAARGAAADIIADAEQKAQTSKDELRRAQDAVGAARLLAGQIVADAREEADKALAQAAEKVHDADERATRIISDARREAEKIIKAAQEEPLARAFSSQLEDQPGILNARNMAQSVSSETPVELASDSESDSEQTYVSAAMMARTQETVVGSPTHLREDHTQIRPVGGNPIPARRSSFDGSRPGDSVYDLVESRRDLATFATIGQAWPKVTVVIPALNEARNLPHVFAKLPEGLHEVIVVDGNSVDNTVATARRLRPGVRIVTQNRCGKGNALACGFAAATGDIIATVDADGSADPAEIPQFVSALLVGADFAKGTRFAVGGGSCDTTRLRRLGNRILSGLVNVLCRTKYSDLCYGYNAFWRRHVPVFGLNTESDVPAGSGTRLWGDGFEVETLINVRIAQAGLKVTEVASYEHSRIHGVSNLNAARDGWRVLRTILAARYYSGRRSKAQSELAAQPSVHCQDTIIS